jgi:hypothetical protein
MNRLWISALCLVAVALTGCAGLPTVKMSPDDRAQTKAVRIASNVPLPEDMFFHGRAQSMGAVGGLLGAAMVASVGSEPKETILNTMKTNGIDLSMIVKAEFSKALTAAGQVNVVNANEPADGELSLIVNMFGFGQTQGFSALLYPVLNVSATLTSTDGRVIWQKTDYISPQNDENTGGHRFEEYVQQPELLRSTWTNIAGIVSRLLVKDMAGSKKK